MYTTLQKTMLPGLNRISSIFYRVAVLAIVVVVGGCSADRTSVPSHVGTWRLVKKTTTIGDSVVIEDLSRQKSIKLLNETHFAFFTHELDSANRDKVPFVSGGGTYKLNAKVYNEFLEYCNYREWENHGFTFNLEVKGDSLIQSGEEEIKDLKIKQVIVEKYIRIN